MCPAFFLCPQLSVGISEWPCYSSSGSASRMSMTRFTDRFRPASRPASHVHREQSRRGLFDAFPDEGHSHPDLQPPADASSGKSAPPEGAPNLSAGPVPPQASVPTSGEKPSPGGLPDTETPMDHTPTGLKAKARDLIAAITMLKQVEAEHRPATDQERATLRRFGGFGPVALHIFPDPVSGRYKDGWRAEGDELKALLTPDEYASAKRTTFSQFFTAPAVMSAIHAAIKQLGIPAGAVVLEPGCGTGAFLSGDHRYLGVELDSITGRIARMLHPQADIRVENFRDTKLPPLDAVIGNVPFADVKLDLNGEKLSLHDYFLAKSLDALKPGGVLACVTSHFTLDKQNAAVRERLARTADFVGAVRLPSDAFKKEGTAVVTDIVFLRKREPGAEPKHADDAWLETGPLNVGDATVAVNRYFLNHPEQVLGKWSRKDTLYGGEGFSVTGQGDLATQLRLAVGRLPRFEPLTVEAQRANPPPEADETHRVIGQTHRVALPFVPPPPLKHVAEGSFFVHDRRIHQVVDGKAEPVVYGGGELWAGGALTGRRMGDLIELRDLARRVLQSQNEGWPTDAREQVRRTLNAAYDRFRSAYGPVNKTTVSETAAGQIRRMPNLVKFREDPDAMLVMSLEEYDEATGTATKAAIMRQDVVGPKPPVTHVASAEEGLLVSLDHKGAIDLPYIATLYGKPEPEIVRQLGDLIYRDPATKKWETADAYLSGNVRVKLAAARAAGPEYARNATALEQVQPEDVLPGDIDANLGAPWIPPSDIRAFAAELFGVPAEAIKASYLPQDAVWGLEADYRATNSVAATADYGTSRINGTDLLGLALNLKTPAIYDPVPGTDQRVVNTTETLAAKEKQRQIKDRFKAWVFADPDRTERLVRTYNDAFNSLRPRLFDGSHLDFPGMSKAITLRPHQVDAVWRCMTGGNTLLAHTVGAGKAQPLDAKVLTPTGWTRMGHLRVGDEVVAGDGTVTRVTGVFPQGEKAIWRVAFSDGASAEACDDHLWLTQTYAERNSAASERRLGKTWACAAPKVRTTAEIRNSLVARHLGAKNHSIPIVGAVQFAEQPVPLDPYTLGVLLGDGCFRQSPVTLCNPDLEILDHLRLPDNVTLKDITGRSRCPTFSFPQVKATGFGADRSRNPLAEAIRDLGLKYVGSPDKFIPDCYKFNAPAVRLGILQGLLDTDGYVSKKGSSTYFYSTSQRLADDVVFLVRSLGGVVQVRVKERPTYRHNGELRVGRPCFILCLSMPPETNPFRLPRKANAVRPKSSYAPRRYIVAVEPAGTQEARCISVAHPSQLYVTDDFVVTHNTNVCIAAAMKLKQTGLAKKSMIVCPNHMLEQFTREWLQLYPNARILTATKDDFTKERRKFLTAKIATGDWDGIVVTHSGFERIAMSDDFQADFLRSQIAEYEALLADKASHGRNLIKTIEKQKAQREEKLKSLLAGKKKDDGLVFDELGVDQIFYDEVQACKNAEVATKMDRVAGVPGAGSQRAFDFAMKAAYLDGKHPGRGLVGASGTPISNSMAELFVMQRYFDPAAMAARGIGHFDAWAATFGEVVEAMEISPDGATLKPRSRFAKFVNLPELVQMFRSFADVQTADMLNLPRPSLKGGKAETVACPMSDEQQAIQARLVVRYERIRNERVDPREDNALAITTDGRKLALDARLLSAGWTTSPGRR